MKPFATVAMFLKKNAEKAKAVRESEMDLPNGLLFKEPSDVHLDHFEDLRQPIVIPSPSCFDFLKKDSVRFQNDLFYETLLMHKFLRVHEEIVSWVPLARKEAAMAQMCYKYVTDFIARMDADEERFIEVLDGADMDEDRRKTLLEFKFGRTFLGLAKVDAAMLVHSLNRKARILIRQRAEAQEKLEHYWQNRKTLKPRVWFWQ